MFLFWHSTINSPFAPWREDESLSIHTVLNPEQTHNKLRTTWRDWQTCDSNDKHGWRAGNDRFVTGMRGMTGVTEASGASSPGLGSMPGLPLLWRATCCGPCHPGRSQCSPEQDVERLISIYRLQNVVQQGVRRHSTCSSLVPSQR